MNLITIAEASAHLRLDSTADNPWLDMWIPAVSEAVATWLKESWRLYMVYEGPDGPLLDSNGDPILVLDSNGDPEPRPVVKAAVLVELAQQYRFRDGSGAQAVPSHAGHGYVLGAGATSLLNALRKSTVQ